ncbi:MAG: hypothetical protein JNL32_06325 [Candidatus Kapabacteria bacterium]|nr:hypothetical protein [Candidatus Kapabacteria bacterium]
MPLHHLTTAIINSDGTLEVSDAATATLRTFAGATIILSIDGHDDIQRVMNVQSLEYPVVTAALQSENSVQGSSPLGQRLRALIDNE